jgi:glycosyltransferase involved in cell wall biosynthesis
MKILYVAPSYPPSIGGAQIHLHALATAIRSLGNEVSVISHWSEVRTDWLWGTTVFSRPAKQYEYEGISVSRLGFPFRTRAAMLPWVLVYYLLMESSVRKISGHMLPYFAEAAGLPSLIHATRIGREFIVRAALDFARERSIPFVLTPVHHPGWRGHLYREYDKIYRDADAVLALTMAEKNTLILEKGVAEEKIHVTGIGPVLSDRYSAEAFRARFGLKERFVLFLGQQYKYKGVDAILQAAPFVWQEHPEVKFVFIGPQMCDSRRLFRKLRDARVVNLGAVDLETKTSALAACEFLCMPSAQESFGGAYVEAWSFRKAVIGGRIGPIACVIDDRRDGLLSSQNPHELAEAISYLLSHPGDCRAMGDAGWRKVQDNYSWERLAKKTLDTYRQLAS